VGEGGQTRVAQQFHMGNRKGETNLTDKVGLATESELMVEEAGEGRAEEGVEGGLGRTVGEVGLVVVGLVLRCD